MAEKVKKCYPDGICPDCAKSIPSKAVEGDQCSNCGHVFWSYLLRDDDYDDDDYDDYDDLWGEW